MTLLLIVCIKLLNIKAKKPYIIHKQKTPITFSKFHSHVCKIVHHMVKYHWNHKYCGATRQVQVTFLGLRCQCYQLPLHS